MKRQLFEIETESITCLKYHHIEIEALQNFLLNEHLL